MSIAVLSLSASRIITAVAKQRLQKTFAGSTVSVGKCRFDPARSIVFSRIEIKRQGLYDFRIKEAGVCYSIPYAIFHMSKPGFDIGIDTLEINDAVIRDLKGAVRIDKGVLFVDPLTARLFNGGLSGSFKAALDKDGEFSMVLTSAGLNLGTLVEDFKLGDKFQVTGKLNGGISLSGNSSGVADIKGKFSTDAPGGALVIKDTRFLENMSRKSGQSIDILMESFKNYRYNTGIIKVSLDKGNLVLDIMLDGDAGKRTFDVILHDIIVEKGR